MFRIIRKSTAHPKISTMLLHPFLPLIALVAQSCKCADIQFTAGAERSGLAAKPAILDDTIFGVADVGPIGEGDVIHDEEGIVHETDPLEEDFVPEDGVMDPVPYIQVAGFVRYMHPDYSSTGGAVFVDSDADHQHSAGDIFIGAVQDDGYFSGFIPLDQADRQMLAVLSIPDDDETGTITLRAPSGSTVISPLTELLTATGLAPVEFNALLMLPLDVDVTQFDPFSNHEDPVLALQVLQVSSIVEMVLDSDFDDLLAAVRDAFPGDELCIFISSSAPEDEMNFQICIMEDVVMAGDILEVAEMEKDSLIISDIAVEII